eukprot:3054944-Prymnesium_polylepis.1
MAPVISGTVGLVPTGYVRWARLVLPCHVGRVCPRVRARTRPSATEAKHLDEGRTKRQEQPERLPRAVGSHHNVGAGDDLQLLVGRELVEDDYSQRIAAEVGSVDGRRRLAGIAYASC